MLYIYFLADKKRLYIFGRLEDLGGLVVSVVLCLNFELKCDFTLKAKSP